MKSILREVNYELEIHSSRYDTSSVSRVNLALVSKLIDFCSEQFLRRNILLICFNFQHKSEAISALKEAIMMAQESNDHLCLQHALTWLFRVQPENQHLLMQRCISKCNALGLSYLTSLGMIFFIKYILFLESFLLPFCVSLSTEYKLNEVPLI